MTTHFAILKHVAPMAIAFGRSSIVVFVVVLFSCATQSNTTDEKSRTVTAPVAVVATQSDDDIVAPLFTDNDSSVTSRSGNSRTQARSAMTSAEEKKTGGDSTPATGTAQEKDSKPETDQTVRSEKEKVADSADDPSHRRTSMPSRGQKEKKGMAVGGVRKALPVNRAAAALFGKWKVDQSVSTPNFVRADSILFIADGRMRIWRNGATEDGRWTWTESEGVKTGGIDNFPLTLGFFEQENGVVAISIDSDRTITLIPDRIFVAPPPVLTAPKTP